MKKGYVYILANHRHGTIYVGVTTDLHSRIRQHKNGVYQNSFSNKYGLKSLVYFEEVGNIQEAITREKQLKGWSRKKKIALIEYENYERHDLSRGRSYV